MQNSAVTTTFPRARKNKRGYNTDQVEDFLDEARQAYAVIDGPSSMTAESIRLAAFSMQRGGYSPSHVDAALERLEDAFAARERERVLSQLGEEAWYSRARHTAQAILNRLDRPLGRRFKRVNFLVVGYHPKDVDAFCRRLKRYFQDGKPMSVEEVRTVAFRTKRGGYSEAQVDRVLDAVIDVMLAVR